MEIIFHSHANQTHFQKKGCAIGLNLNVRVFELRSGIDIVTLQLASNIAILTLSKCKKICV